MSSPLCYQYSHYRLSDEFPGERMCPYASVLGVSGPGGGLCTCWGTFTVEGRLPASSLCRVLSGVTAQPLDACSELEKLF